MIVATREEIDPAIAAQRLLDSWLLFISSSKHICLKTGWMHIIRLKGKYRKTPTHLLIDIYHMPPSKWRFWMIVTASV
jgi:hypothetical protein